MTEHISLNTEYLSSFVASHELEFLKYQVESLHTQIHEFSGPGQDGLGWLELPFKDEQNQVDKIISLAESIRKKSNAFVVIGVGGSYIGARAAIEFLRPAEDSPEIIYLGHNLSPRYLKEVMEHLENKEEIYVNVISKSGTTLETSLAFRVVRDYLNKRYGRQKAASRIIATTDSSEGKLRELADEQGYETLSIPDDVGGRYSILTPVGLLPIAVSGIDIEEMLSGARGAYGQYSEPRLQDNACYQYAAIRNILYNKGKVVELLVNYDPFTAYLSEWWKQLFGESEGKDNKGIFPARVDFTTDLHSLGQYIQEGRKQLFCTTVWWEEPLRDISIPEIEEENDRDGLGYLAKKNLSDINRQAFTGTVKAHTEGGVPNIIISVPDMSPYYFGELIYFFEKSCAMSGYLLGVNPFNQPGVETYKNNVKSLLRDL